MAQRGDVFYGFCTFWTGDWDWLRQMNGFQPEAPAPARPMVVGPGGCTVSGPRVVVFRDKVKTEEHAALACDRPRGHREEFPVPGEPRSVRIPEHHAVVVGYEFTWYDNDRPDVEYQISDGRVMRTVRPPQIPHCPFCGSVGFEMPRATWLRQAREWEDGTSPTAMGERHPGYVAMLLWGENQCYRDYTTLEAAWIAAGRP